MLPISLQSDYTKDLGVVQSAGVFQVRVITPDLLWVWIESTVLEAFQKTWLFHRAYSKDRVLGHSNGQFYIFIWKTHSMKIFGQIPDEILL